MRVIFFSFLCVLNPFCGVILCVGDKLRYMGYFASLLHPQEEKVGYYFPVRDMSGGLKNMFY